MILSSCVALGKSNEHVFIYFLAFSYYNGRFLLNSISC